MTRGLLVAGQVLLLLLAMQPNGSAQQDGEPAPDGGLIPAPVGTDLQILRKLLGLPLPVEEQPVPAEPAIAPVEVPPPAPPQPPAEAPVVEIEKPAAPDQTRPKPAGAKPVVRKPGKAVVKPAQKPVAKPDQSEAVKLPAKPEPATETVTNAALQGSNEDIPPPGTVVSASNMARWKHMLGPSIQWAVSRGATMPVIAATPAPIEPFREEATRRYSAQVTLSPDKNAMRDYVAGIPFPFVSEDDPDAAVKMMFNFEGRVSVDDVEIRNFACDTGRIPPGRGLEIERHYEVNAFRRLYYTSRFHVDPKPTWPTPDGVRYREMLGPLQEPFDLKGAGFTYTRYQEPARPDDSWLYFPQIKRVRRLSSAQRSEGVFGQDIDLDSYYGYAGHPAWSHWKYLGKKTVLGVMHARNLPAVYQAPPADFFPEDVWEPREVYILLAVSRLGGYNFGQRVIYLDREGLLIPYTEIYDLKGALWKSLVLTWSFGRKPIPTATRSVYDYEQYYAPMLSMMDVQENHVTRCYFPSPNNHGEEGWYYNFGDAEGTSEEVFSVSHFIEGGR